MLQVDSVIAVTTGRVRAWQELFDWPQLAAAGLRVLSALVVALLANWALGAIIRRVERSLGQAEVLSAHEQRARTLVGLLRSIGRVVILTMHDISLKPTQRAGKISFSCENRNQVVVVPSNGVVDELDVLRGPSCDDKQGPTLIAPNAAR